MGDTAVAQQCVASVEQGVMRLRLIGGCPLNEISYELADGTNENAENPNNTSCFVFHPNGGGVAACGAYLESTIPLGIISLNDTSGVIRKSRLNKGTKDKGREN